jgi:hypothetical protein
MNLRVRRVKLIFKTQWFVRKMTCEMTLARRSSDHDLRDLPPATHRRGGSNEGRCEYSDLPCLHHFYVCLRIVGIYRVCCACGERHAFGDGQGPTTYSMEMGSSKATLLLRKGSSANRFFLFLASSGTLPSNNDEQSVALERGLLINCPPHPMPRSWASLHPFGVMNE